MKKQSILYILVGNIGSGKTTWVKKNIKKLNAIILSRDSLRYMLGGGEYLFDVELEPFVFKAEKANLKIFLNTKRNIVIDEVGIFIKSRKPYILLAKKYGYKIVAISFPILPKKISVRRRLRNNHGNQEKKIWEIVWTRFNNRYEIPTKKEGFGKVIKIGD